MSEEFKSTIIMNEQRIFRCILENPKLIYELQPNWFSCAESNKLYKTLQYLYENHLELTPANIATKSGQTAYLDAPPELFPDVEYNTQEWEFYLRTMKLEFVKNDLGKNILDELKVKALSKEELDFDALVELHKDLSKDIDLIRGNSSRLQTITQIGQRYRGVLVSRKLGETYSYGDYLIDRMIPTGAAPGQMTTVFGSTGMGKSMFNLNLFSKQINRRIPCMYVTLEMDEITTMDRLIALRQRIPFRDLMLKNAGEDLDKSVDPDYVMSVAEQGLADLKKYEDRFFIVDEPALSLDDLESLIADAKKRMGVNYLICSIDLWTMLHGISSKASDIEDAVNRTSEIAKRQNVHLINVVQANREADKKSVSSIEAIDTLRIKTVNAIKNSGAIGERARAVLSVFRAKHYAETLFPDDPQLEFMDDIFEVSLVKANNAQIGGRVKYLYDGECFRLYPFIESSHEEESEDEEV